FSVCRQAQECVIEIFRAHLALTQGMRYAAREHVTQPVEPDLQVVRGTFPVRGQHATRLVDQYKAGLGATTIDTEKGLHDEGGKGCMDTPCTTDSPCRRHSECQATARATWIAATRASARRPHRVDRARGPSMVHRRLRLPRRL